MKAAIVRATAADIWYFQLWTQWRLESMQTLDQLRAEISDPNHHVAKQKPGFKIIDLTNND